MESNSPVRCGRSLYTSLLTSSRIQRCLAAVMLTCAAAFAGPAANAADVGIDFLAVLPRGQLDENLGSGYGVGLQFLVPIGNGPFVIGAEASVASYADQRRPFFDDLDVETSNNIAALNAVLRAQATSGRVRPYVDAILGVKVFQTQSTLVDTCSICEDEVLESETELDDTAFSYGFGAGLQMELKESRLFLDTRVRYTRGRDATYLTRGSITDENLDDRLRQSRTDTLSFHLGLSFRL
jgi:opacity protein-like surface antigen